MITVVTTNPAYVHV